MIKYVLAIDPGTRESAACIVRMDDYKPLYVTKAENDVIHRGLYSVFTRMNICPFDVQCVIERMHNPMNVDSNVFLTCEWIGRFSWHYECYTSHECEYVFRYQEYKQLCANIYARNDKGIRQSLADRFAYGIPNFGKGTTKQNGWFFGFSADMWSSYAIAVTWIDMQKEKTA